MQAKIIAASGSPNIWELPDDAEIEFKIEGKEPQRIRKGDIIQLPDGSCYLPFGPVAKEPRSIQPGTLENFIKQKIDKTSQKRILFPEFMELALFTPTFSCPEGGYYERTSEQDGEFRDFSTYPIIHSPLLGRAASKKIHKYWLEMGSPKPFRLVAMGEGNGIFMRDILRGLLLYDHELYSNTQVTIIERSKHWIGIQKQNLGAHKNISWLYQNAITNPLPDVENGIFLSNELPDTFPVHLIYRCPKTDLIAKAWVKSETWVNGIIEFAEEWVACDQKDPLDERLVEAVILADKGLPAGKQIPISLNAIYWMVNVMDHLKRGFHITFDYGYTGTTYPNRELLWTMLDKSSGKSPYWEPGKRDITFHVDFDVLKRIGEMKGARTRLLGFQEEFFEKLSWSPPSQFDEDQKPQILKEMTEYLPGKTGFLVLVQSKGL